MKVLYRLNDSGGGKCVSCNWEYEDMAWILVGPGIDPVVFFLQNGGLCAECVLGLLPENEDAWEVKAHVPARR